jgi:DUF1680 family protein
LDTYVLTSTADRAWVHFYGNATIALGEGAEQASATMSTDYPWDGRVGIDFDRSPSVELRLRVPAWADRTEARIDGEPAALKLENGYLIVPPAAAAHRIELEFAMPASIVRPHPRVDALRGSVAVTRGPIVYCLEQNDLPEEVNAEDVRLGAEPQFSLGQAAEIDAPAVVVNGLSAVSTAHAPLYASTADDAARVALGPVPLIPYFRWGNRRKSAMRVWIPQL